MLQKNKMANQNEILDSSLIKYSEKSKPVIFLLIDLAARWMEITEELSENNVSDLNKDILLLESLISRFEEFKDAIPVSKEMLII